MFYFHGAKGENFAIVSDDSLHINAHFIGNRPQGRTRDFTWVQALSVMFDTHTLIIAAKKIQKWDDSLDALIVRWDGEAVNVPIDGEAEWRVETEERVVMVERTDDINTISVTVSGLLELNVNIRPIGEEENRVHNYQLPPDDAFAHLETQFKFKNLTDLVEGVLGKTYQPGYVSPVKVGVLMPMMGGEDKYQTPSLYSPLCKVCRFQRPISEHPTTEGASEYWQDKVINLLLQANADIQPPRFSKAAVCLIISVCCLVFFELLLWSVGCGIPVEIRARVPYLRKFQIMLIWCHWHC